MRRQPVNMASVSASRVPAETRPCPPRWSHLGENAGNRSKRPYQNQYGYLEGGVLDQTVSAIVPGLPAAWSKVTIRHCLSHTTGLPYAVGDQFNINALDGDRDQLFVKLSSKPVVEPGTQIDYNTTDFVLLTMVIEKVSGLSYEEYIQRFVLDPAGIKTARFGRSLARGRSRTEAARRVGGSRSRASI